MTFEQQIILELISTGKWLAIIAAIFVGILFVGRRLIDNLLEDLEEG